MTARFIIGDTRDVTATLPDSSVDLVFTSPPFLALRSYLPADHQAKDREIGSEATPAEFLSVLLDLAVEWGRVLTPTGSLVVELGDTYSGTNPSGGGGLADNRASRQMGAAEGRDSRGTERPTRDLAGWPLAKSLCGIPTLYTWSLAYGRNLLAPDHNVDPWRIRNLIVWHRPNPPVGALGDKYRPSTSYITVATKSATRWFDLDAVRSGEQSKAGGATTIGDRGSHNEAERKRIVNTGSHPSGAPPLDCWFDEWDDTGGDDCWTITTDPYKGSHYATFPRALANRVIQSMCPLEVCTECGEPRRRIVDAKSTGQNLAKPGQHGLPSQQAGAVVSTHVPKNADRATVGWSDCGHDNYRPGVVLDPFAGSGTTLQQAVGLGRHAVGIDIDERNADLARKRCGMFLDVVIPKVVT